MTGLKDRKRMVIELFLDSLVPSPFLPEQGTLLDVGSGAGFPGLPLKIHCPQRETFLLESNSKKVSFLRQVVRRIKLRGVQAVKSRIELIPKETPYDMVTARAFAQFGKTLELCAPLVREGGHLVVYLGVRAKETLKENEGLVAEGHLRLCGMVSYCLPGKGSERHTAIFERVQGSGLARDRLF